VIIYASILRRGESDGARKAKEGCEKRLRKNLKKFRKSLDKGCTIWYTL